MYKECNNSVKRASGAAYVVSVNRIPISDKKIEKDLAKFSCREIEGDTTH